MIPALTISAPASGGPYATLEKKCWVLLLSLLFVCFGVGSFCFLHVDKFNHSISSGPHG